MPTDIPINKVWIVIPAYNEAIVIRDTISEVRRSFRHIVVVDDHSTDNTAEIALDAGAVVCRHPLNLGQGAALQTGIDYALQRGATAIVTFDADGQHCVSDAEKMIAVMLDGDVDVVLGSRFLGNDAVGITARKRLLLKAAAIYTAWTSGLRITDTHNGLRCLSRKAALAIRIRHNRMAHASEILEKIGQLGLSYVEVPCTITYTTYSTHKGQRASGAFRILIDLIIARLSR